MNRVREYREQAGISQTELARRVRVAGANLSAIERGKVAPWPKVRRALVRVLKQPESELFPDGHTGGQ